MSDSNYDLSYLSIDSIQEGVGASQIIPLLIGLSKQGKKISLTTFEKNSPSTEILDVLSNHGIRWNPQDFGAVGALGGFKRLRKLQGVIPPSNVIHGRSDIPTAAAVFSDSAAPILWDVRSLWSDQRKVIDTPGWNPLTSRAARTLEDVSARNSSAMVTLTAAVVPILEKRHKKLPEIRSVIPTCVQTKTFLMTPFPTGRMTCLLSGTFNNFYDIEETRRVILTLKKSMDLQVIWARGGESPKEKLDVGEDYTISATHSEMPALVSAAHFGIAICKQENFDSLAASVPTKIAEFLASGRPVIVSKNIGDLDTLIPKHGAGVVVHNGQDMGVLTHELNNLLSDSNTPDRCRSLAREHFDMDKAVTVYSDIYRKMLN
jgi:hypothetical protein